MRYHLTTTDVYRMLHMNDEGLRPGAIALRIGCSRVTVTRCLNNPEKYISKKELPPDYREVLEITKEEFKSKYPNWISVLSDTLEVNKNTLQGWLDKKNGIPVKIIEKMRGLAGITPEQIKERKSLLGRI